MTSNEKQKTKVVTLLKVTAENGIEDNTYGLIQLMGAAFPKFSGLPKNIQERLPSKTSCLKKKHNVMDWQKN